MIEREIPEPIGKFIIEQKDIKEAVGNDGYYYHYADVCKLMKRYHDFLLKTENKNES